MIILLTFASCIWLIIVGLSGRDQWRTALFSRPKSIRIRSNKIQQNFGGVGLRMTEAGPSTPWAWVEGGNGKTVLDAKKWKQLFPGRNKPSQIGQWLHFESDCVRRRRLPWAPLTLAHVGEKLTDVGSFTLLLCLCPFRSQVEHRSSHGAFHLALGLVVQSPPANFFLNIWEGFSPKTSELQCRKPDVERSYNSFSSIKLVQVAGSQIEVNISVILDYPYRVLKNSALFPLPVSCIPPTRCFWLSALPCAFSSPALR